MKNMRELSVFQDMFNMSPPWKVRITSYSEQERTIQLRIDFGGEKIDCPVCGVTAGVKQKEIVAWRASDFFEYKTHVTASLPVADRHGTGCRADRDPSVLTNTLLLDLIVRQTAEAEKTSPFYFLFHAVHVSC